MTVWREVVFKDYESAGLGEFEVAAAEGKVLADFGRLPMELTPHQAAQVGRLLFAAAEELESAAASRKAIGGGE